MDQEKNQKAAVKKQEQQAVAARPGRAAWRKKYDRRLKLVRTAMLLLGSAVLLLGLLLLILPSFRVREIKVEGNLGITTEEQIKAACGVQLGDELIGLDLREVMARVKAACPNITVKTVSKSLGGIKITVDSAATIYTAYAGRFFSLNNDFYAMSVSEAEADFQGLLKVKLPDIAGITLGEPVVYADHETDRTYIQTMLELFADPAVGSRVDLLDVSKKFNVAFVIDGSRRIVLGGVQDLSLKLELAEQILKEREGSSEFAIVDVSDTGRSTYRPAASLADLIAG